MELTAKYTDLTLLDEGELQDGDLVWNDELKRWELTQMIGMAIRTGIEMGARYRRPVAGQESIKIIHHAKTGKAIAVNDLGVELAQGKDETAVQVELERKERKAKRLKPEDLFPQRPMFEYERQRNRKRAEATAWRWFSLWIRIKDADENGIVKCYTCTGRHHYKKMDCGHFKPQGHYKGIKFDERNNHPQCVPCNHHNSGRLDVYERNLIEDYGPNIINELMAADRLAPRKHESDFREIADKYRELCKTKLKHINQGQFQ